MKKLKIAIQKSGRLHKESLNLLKNCGIHIDDEKGQLKVEVENFPLEILYLRNSDIPQYLEDGVIDIAIIGENLLLEKRKKIQVLEKLGFSKCRLSLAVPKEEKVNSLDYFQGRKIATSFPNTLSSFLKERKINAEIHLISGSVEISPNIGLADAICDLVSTGSTLFKNGLREIEVILHSEAVLASCEKLETSKQEILDKFIFRIRSVLRAKNRKYILMNIPNAKLDQVIKILPVLKSPTVLPLAKKDWSSLHSVVEEDSFWEVIDDLKVLGAEDILVVPINKMVL